MGRAGMARLHGLAVMKGDEPITMTGNGQHAGAGNDERSDAETMVIVEPGADARRKVTSDDFLIPGPTPESNEGLGRWGLSWLVFSIVLMGLMLLISFICLQLAVWTGIA